MKPLIVEYLQTHSLQNLEDEHGVVTRASQDYSKFSANYDQILIRNGNLLAEQCRGMVLRPQIPLKESDFKIRQVGVVEVLAWPMDRFYNLGDPAAAQVDWSDPALRVYEKLDGTMIVAYWDELQKRWHAATRSVSEADLPIKGGDLEIGDLTFSGLFFAALKATRENLRGLPSNWQFSDLDEIVDLNKELTYVFELTSPHNRVVVKYDSPRVTLLAARHTTTGQEIPIETLRLEHVLRPKTWPLSEPSAIDAFVNSADPAALEGCVVCDSQFRRLKIKNKAWVVSSRAKDLISSHRGALEAIIMGTIDDVIPLVDESAASKLLSMQRDLGEYMKSIDRKFMSWKEESLGNRKRFAELVLLSGDWPSPYFQLFDNKAKDALDWIITSQSEGRLSPRILDTLAEKMKMHVQRNMRSQDT